MHGICFYKVLEPFTKATEDLTARTNLFYNVWPGVDDPDGAQKFIRIYIGVLSWSSFLYFSWRTVLGMLVAILPTVWVRD